MVVHFGLTVLSLSTVYWHALQSRAFCVHISAGLLFMPSVLVIPTELAINTGLAIKTFASSHSNVSGPIVFNRF